MSSKYPTFGELLRNPIHLFAFGFGSGIIRPAPGTWGSLLGTLLIIPFLAYLNFTLLGYLTLLLTFAIGCYLCGKTCKDYGVHDHGGIVWDEFVGIWVIFILFPKELLSTWGGWSYLIGFILFRIFDIWKPFPIRQVDRKAPGGFGVMIDDVLASTYVLIILFFFNFFK